MTGVIRKFVRWLLQIAAGCVIVLALLVGVARLLLPEVASFSADIRAAVRDRTGFELDFELLSAGMSIHGPELRMTVVEVRWPDRSELLKAEQIAISLDLANLITNRSVMPKRVLVRGSSAEIAIAADGSLRIQGRPLDDFKLRDEPVRSDALPNLRLHFEDIRFAFSDERIASPGPRGVVNELIAELDNGRIRITGDIEPGKLFGRKLDMRGDMPVALFLEQDESSKELPWNLWVWAQDFRMDAWLPFLRTENLPLINSGGSAAVELNMAGMQIVSLQTELKLTDIQLFQPAAPPAIIDSIDGDIGWQKTPDGWTAAATEFRIERDNTVWPSSNIAVSYAETDEQKSVSATADFLRADDLTLFLEALNSEQLRELGLTGQARGDIRDLSFSLSQSGETVQDYQLSAAVERLGYRSAEHGVDINGFTGNIAADHTGGSIELETRDAAIELQQLFRERLAISRLDGLAIWRASSEGYRVLANSIKLATPDGQAEASLELTSNLEFGEPWIDLRATSSMQDIANAARYFPTVLPEQVLDWLGDSLRGGSVPAATIQLTGALQDFPFENKNGEFLVDIDFKDGTLAYAPGWPIVTNANGKLIFSGPALFTVENSAEIAGINVENVSARIADLRSGEIMIESSATTELAKILGFLRNSPIRKALGPILDDFQVAGPAEGKIALRLPVRDMDAWRLTGQMDTRGTSLGLKGLDFKLSDVRGRTTISNTQITVAGATGKLFQAPVTLDVRPLGTNAGDSSHLATVTGPFDVAIVADKFALPLRQYFSGTVEAKASALLAPGDAAKSEPFNVRIESDLAGLVSRLPYPLDKAAVRTDAIDMHIRFPAQGTIGIDGTLARGVNWQLEMLSNQDGWEFNRGAVNRGATRVALPEQPGLEVSGYVDSLRLQDWLDLEVEAASAPVTAGGQDDANSRWQDAFRVANLQLDELVALGFIFSDVDTLVRFGENAWDIDISGPWAQGKIFLPYDFNAGAPAELEMERLLLIEAEEATGSGKANPATTDPRNLPAINAKVEDFALGNLRFGALDARIAKTRDGLRSNRLKTTAASFSTDSSADWVVVGNAQRSRLNVALTSQDVGKTLTRLGYGPLISGESGKVTASLLWEGGPSMDLLYASTGRMDFDFQNGRVSDLDTGGGRLIGLLSLAYLPRRLSLDFRDITADGLEYTSISGRFQLDFGNAWTCNMGLISEVADIAMIGRAGLVAEDYDQLAVVRPHVSSMLPLPAVVLGGPTIGVATLLISQLFKKPLNNIGETYYAVEGSWEDPQFNKVDRDDINTASFADCERQLPNLSPEEIAALKELLSEPGIELPSTGADNPGGAENTDTELAGD